MHWCNMTPLPEISSDEYKSPAKPGTMSTQENQERVEAAVKSGSITDAGGMMLNQRPKGFSERNHIERLVRKLN